MPRKAANRGKKVKDIKVPYEKHEYCDIFPEMNADEYSRLKTDIDTNGFRSDFRIWLFEGKVLDGYNRMKAAFDLGLTFENGKYVQEFKGSNDEALKFVMASNFNRRHLTQAQKADVLLTYNELAGRGRPDKSVAATDLPKTARELSEEHDVSETTIQKVSTVRKKGIDELKQAVRDGEMNAQEAAKIAQLSPKEQKKALKAGKAPAPSAPPVDKNVVPKIKAQIIYTDKYVRDIKGIDPPATKDNLWFFRCNDPDDLIQALSLFDAHGYTIVSYIVLDVKSNKSEDGITTINKPLVLVASHGDPSPLQAKFEGQMAEQKFLEHFGKAFEPNTSKATFFGKKPNDRWDDWKDKAN